MRTRPLIAGLAIASLFTAACAQAGDKITLKLRPEKGAEYAMVMKMDTKTKMQMGDQPMDMTMHMENESTQKVEDVAANGDVTLKTTVDAIRMKMDGMMKMEYDSRKPETGNSPMAKGMAAQVGKAATTKMSADGKVVKMEGVAADKQGISVVGASGYPDRPVGVGDTWDAKMDLGAMAKAPGMEMKMDVHYTLVERKGGTAKIKMEGTMTGKVDGTLSGVMSVDEKTGMPQGTEMDMKMKMPAPGPDMPAPEVTMKMTLTSTKK